MEECSREMSQRDQQPASGLKYLAAAAHAERSGNPFDAQFRVAKLNNITQINYGSTTVPTSPLHTPSISLNETAPYMSTHLSIDFSGPTPLIPTFSAIIPDNAFLKTPVPHFSIPELRIENPSPENVTQEQEKQQHQHQNATEQLLPRKELPDTVMDCAPTTTTIINALKKPTLSLTPKSNMVSVICQSTKSTDTSPIEEDVQSCETGAPLELKDYSVRMKVKCESEPMLPLIMPHYPNPMNDSSNQSTQSNSSTNSVPSMIRHNGDIVIKNIDKQSRAKKPAKTGHRKEKTEEEMLMKIRDTELALPPKAKPGRKSKNTVEGEGDVKERKKRSLERNRAAAMRCRLKKKKEVNSLKDKCDNYQSDNERLIKKVHSLQAEVDRLKKELLEHEKCLR